MIVQFGGACPLFAPPAQEVIGFEDDDLLLLLVLGGKEVLSIFSGRIFTYCSFSLSVSGKSFSVKFRGV